MAVRKLFIVVLCSFCMSVNVVISVFISSRCSFMLATISLNALCSSSSFSISRCRFLDRDFFLSYLDFYAPGSSSSVVSFASPSSLVAFLRVPAPACLTYFNSDLKIRRREARTATRDDTGSNFPNVSMRTSTLICFGPVAVTSRTPFQGF